VFDEQSRSERGGERKKTDERICECQRNDSGNKKREREVMSFRDGKALFVCAAFD